MSIDNEIGQPPRLLPRTIEDVLRAWMVRCSGVALLAAACLISIAMLTWSAHDPSLSLNTAQPAQNILGPIGAMVADFFIHTLGLSVVFFVVPPAVLGLQLALGDDVQNYRRQLALSAVATIAIAGGCSALPTTQSWPLELGYGGIIGDFGYSVAHGVLGEVWPSAAGTLAGIVYFALGFWAFSRAICLDQYNVLDVPLAQFGWSSNGIASRVTWPLRQAQTKDQHATLAPEHALMQPGLPTTQEDPSAWSLDARLQEYVASTQTDANPDMKQDNSGSMFNRLAARFGPAAVATTEAHEPQASLSDEGPHQIVLLGEGDDGDDVDLPNVLKRARKEASGILPSLSPRATPHSEELLPPLVPQELVQQTAPKVVATGYRRPSLNFLTVQKTAQPSADTSPSVLQGRARMLEDVLADFRIKGEIKDVRPGPVITQFELEPSRGTKSSRVISLADDVARSMSAVSARIAVVPGRNAIGIELPNTRRETFGLRELIDSQAYLDNGAKLPLVLGKGIGGEPVLTDLARMPHLLVAGTTGSGKSVGVNAMILSLIYRLGPQNCRFLMIDPKMLELSAYNGIPHLLTPVITDPQKAVTALAWAVGEMEERYKRMAELGVRSIDAFNSRVETANQTGEKLGRTVQTGFDPATGDAVFEETTFDYEPLPYIVIVVDEFADLMAVAGKEIEGLVQRLAQMARAAGIHMIMATQRPSVDVVTGTIKANFPTRISYRVASRIDSRTILNEQGGEQLLGQGDMLFLDGTGSVQRVHGPFVSDEEVEAITNSLRGTYPTAYVGDILAGDATLPEGPAAASTKAGDLYEQAVEIVLRDQKASTSYLQRRLSIGYNRAADLIDRMEDQGVIGAANHAGRREILLAG